VYLYVKDFIISF